MEAAFVIGALLLLATLCLLFPLSALLAILWGVGYLRGWQVPKGVAIASIVLGALSLLIGASLLLIIGWRVFAAAGEFSQAWVAQFDAYKDRPAPNFALFDIDGSIHSLSRYHGYIVVLNFWAFW